MAIITTLVGLGVLLVFTVLGWLVVGSLSAAASMS